jgi:FtsH-binding integral membrane protein
MAYLAYLSYTNEKEGWVWIFGLFAILFNPFIPIYLNRIIWMGIDLATAVFLLLSIFLLKFKEQSTKTEATTKH